MSARIESQAEPIPGYRLIERLGGGGFGEVWKAEAPGGLLKAMKFVYGDLQTVDDGDSARAEQELKALSRVKTVRHPFILSLERFDIIDGQLIIVSELADRNLWDRFRECRAAGLQGIPRAELLSYMEEISEALDHMNIELDLMHLDIKPQNLFLVGSHIKVADFGLVKDLEGLVASVTGGVTPVYAAPETFEGYVSRFSDQYSLAIVFQELLTGQRPFNASNTRQLILQHLQQPPDLTPLPPWDRHIIGRGLAKDPNARYPNCTEFVEALCAAGIGQPRLPEQAELHDTPFGAPQTTLPPGAAPAAPFELDPDAAPRTMPAIEPGTTTPLGGPVTTPTPGRFEGEPYASLLAVPTVMRPAEETGDGVLMPALIVGLGQVGRTLLEQVRHELRERHGDGTRIPHVRLLSIDTDPVTRAPQVAPEPLGADETLLARLSRPSRYLRIRDSMPPLADWLDQSMLYRIPRDLVTTGIRALGRLAFIDNHRAIVARLRWELESITGRATLQAAEQATGQQLRSNWPRVYVLAHLGGGTGSGMFLDLAYTVRAVLRELGFGRCDVVGVLILPPADDASGMDLPLANTYASLTELLHYMKPGNNFQARYEARTPALVDEGPPFGRCVFLPLECEQDPVHVRELSTAVGEWLHRDLFTPLGRAADAVRHEGQTESVRRKQKEATVASASPYQSFWLHIQGLPRREVLRRAGLILGRTVTAHWASKGEPDTFPGFWEQMEQNCLALELDPPSVLQKLVTACADRLETPPDVVFTRWLEPFQQRTAHGVPDPAICRALLKEADLLLGAVDPKASQHASQAQTVLGDGPTLLPPVLRETAELLVRKVEPLLVRKVLDFFEAPGYRLAGSEEAINQTILCLENWLVTLEEQHAQLAQQLQEAPQCVELAVRDCERAFDRAQRGIKLTPAQRQFACTVVPERLQRYVILRFQHLTLQSALVVYRSLRGRLSDQKKEISFCRNRLRQLQGMFDKVPEPNLAEQRTSIRSILLPDQCQTIEETVQRCVAVLNPDHWSELDAAVQQRVQQEFGGVYKVCTLTGHQHFERLRNVIQRESARYLGERLKFDDAAALFLAQQADDQSRATALDTLYERSGSDLAIHQNSAPRQVELMLAPETPAGNSLLDIAGRIFRSVHMVSHRDREEIVVYREVVGLALYDLPHLGPLAKKAYESACAVEHFTPHTRLDVNAWKPPSSVTS